MRVWRAALRWHARHCREPGDVALGEGRWAAQSPRARAPTLRKREPSALSNRRTMPWATPPTQAISASATRAGSNASPGSCGPPRRELHVPSRIWAGSTLSGWSDGQKLGQKFSIVREMPRAPSANYSQVARARTEPPSLLRRRRWRNASSSQSARRRPRRCLRRSSRADVPHRPPRR
jgi:hypothetical protein